MKRFLLFFFVINLYSYSYSQNEAMVPKTGTIVFRKEETITDSIAYKKSTKIVSQKMFEIKKTTIKKEREQQGLSIDSVELNNLISQIKREVKENLYLELYGDVYGTYKFYNLFNKDEIYYYCTLNDTIIGDTLTYYISKNKKVFNGKIKPNNGFYPKIENLKLQEFQNETKIIYGYKCFKILLSFSEVFDDDDFDKFKNNLVQRKELWVTEKIKSPVHPIIRINEILEKYYPLEIIETIDEIKGFKTVYKLDKIEIH